MHYHGSEVFFTAAQRDELIVEWRYRTTCEVAEVRDWIENRYGVVYKSKPSHYDFLAEVAMSRRKSHPENP